MSDLNLIYAFSESKLDYSSNLNDYPRDKPFSYVKYVNSSFILEQISSLV